MCNARSLRTLLSTHPRTNRLFLIPALPAFRALLFALLLPLLFTKLPVLFAHLLAKLSLLFAEMPACFIPRAMLLASLLAPQGTLGTVFAAIVAFFTSIFTALLTFLAPFLAFFAPFLTTFIAKLKSGAAQVIPDLLYAQPSRKSTVAAKRKSRHL